MKKIQAEHAERRALNLLDEWLDCTGVVQKFSGYHSELESIIIDAVHCGIQAAFEIEEPLPSESV